MKVDLKKEIVGIDGVKSLPNPDKKGIPLTLRDVCINAVLQPKKEDTGKQKAEAYELFLKLRGTKQIIDLSAEEIVKIKTKIGEIYAPLISGQTWNILEGGKK